MFTFKEHQPKASGSGNIAILHYGTQHLCKYESWAFASCGVDQLYSFNSCASFWDEKENITALNKWLTTNSPGGGWNPLNYMFAITETQAANMPGLVKHPMVKQIDEFLNEAHGPNKIMVFRMSNNQKWWKKDKND